MPPVAQQQQNPIPSATPYTDKVEAILERHNKMKALKQPWLPTWQLIGEYVFSRKQNFTHQIMPGQFLTGRIFDSSGPTACHLMASSMIGALYPNGERTFTITPPRSMPKAIAKSQEVKDYYQRVTEEVAAIIGNPRAGFLLALEEYMKDQCAFGIGGISVLDQSDTNSDLPCIFKAVDAKQITIDEGPDGFVDVIYIEKEMTVRQVVLQYGVETVSQKTREAYRGRRMNEPVRVLHAIEPRLDNVVGGFGNMQYPIASIHIEIEAKHILKESGYHELPVRITRFWKAMGEIYGRSPAMEAMSDILEANSLREALIIATEKMLDPPLIVNDDGTFGGATIDTSAGALVVRRISGRVGDANHKPIEPLVTIGEPEHTQKRIDQLKENIFDAFFIDRLLDLNNEQRMTLGEANIRNKLRGQSLGMIYSRQIAELFSPIIERVFNILLANNMLGVAPNSIDAMRMQRDGDGLFIIPDPVLKLMMRGKDAYDVTFTSPAARIMRAEELQGILDTTKFMTEAAAQGIMTEMADVLDPDEVIRRVVDLTGAPVEIVRDLDSIKQIRQARQQQQATMAKVQADHLQGQTTRSVAQAAQAAAKAGIPPQAVLGGGQQQQQQQQQQVA